MCSMSILGRLWARTTESWFLTVGARSWAGPNSVLRTSFLTKVPVLRSVACGHLSEKSRWALCFKCCERLFWLVDVQILKSQAEPLQSPGLLLSWRRIGFASAGDFCWSNLVLKSWSRKNNSSKCPGLMFLDFESLFGFVVEFSNLCFQSQIETAFSYWTSELCDRSLLCVFRTNS